MSSSAPPSRATSAPCSTSSDPSGARRHLPGPLRRLVLPPDETYFADDEVSEQRVGRAERRSSAAPGGARQRGQLLLCALALRGAAAGAHREHTPNSCSRSSAATRCLQFIDAGLRDVSITRARGQVDWGVPVPGDPSQIIYVWFDALINYLTVAGYPDDAERWRKWWPGRPPPGRQGHLRPLPLHALAGDADGGGAGAAAAGVRARVLDERGHQDLEVAAGT